MESDKSFHHILEKLKALQIILNKKFQLEKKIIDLPQEVELKEQIVFRMKENFLVADTQYQDLKKNVLLKNDELDRLQNHREKYEEEISQVSTQRDYEQIDRAIKENQDQELIMRSDYNALESKFSAFEEEYNSTENLLTDQEAELAEMKKEMKTQSAKYQSNIKIVKQEEALISVDLGDKLVFNFERIIKSKGGDGIVAVKNNICNGCHMILPLQFVNEICKEEEVMNCPYCSKILYYDGNIEEEVFEQVETAGLTDLFDEVGLGLDDFDEEDYEMFVDKDTIGSDGYAIPTEDDVNNESDEDDHEDDSTDEDEEERNDIDGDENIADVKE